MNGHLTVANSGGRANIVEPLGTITKYCPFVDEETKSILGSLMEQASSYNDFVLLLGETVVRNDVPFNLAYIAAVQAWWTRTEESMKMIQEKYKDEPCIRPWGHIHTTTMSDQVRYHDSVVAAIDKALETSLTDWMEIELHFLHTHFHYPAFGDVPSFSEPLEKAKNLIDSSPSLVCFQPLLHMYEGHAQGMEEHRRNGVATLRRGLELAKTNDDKLYAYLNLEPLASDMINYDIRESLDLFQEMYDLAQDLEVPYMTAEVLFDSALVFGFAGEYDLAISSLHEAVKILGGDETAWVELSKIYAMLGDGQKALEWADRAIEDAGHLEYAILYLRKAWALALLNRVEEAKRNLDTAYSLILNAGQERRLGVYYHVAGVIELAEGDYQTALDYLQKSQEIEDRLTVGYQNRVLLDLARVEILIAGQSKGSTQSVTPGKWLSTLEKYALDHDLPGVRMQAAMLKAEFYKNHKQFRDARAILVDALDITDSRGVTTLKKRISDQIKEVNGLMHDEEMAS